MDTINAFLYSPFMIAVQVFSFIISAGLGVLYWRILQETGVLERSIFETRTSWNPERLAVADLAAKWQGVVARTATNDESQWKLAIIEADTILDEAIKQLGFKGKTMGDRMKQIKPGKFPMLEEAWRAHRVRNYIVHDPTYHISAAAASRVFGIYQDIFIRLGIIHSVERSVAQQ